MTPADAFRWSAEWYERKRLLEEACAGMTARSWGACVAALMGSALFAGCEVARSKWGCAILAGAVMVAAAVALVLKVTQ